MPHTTYSYGFYLINKTLLNEFDFKITFDVGPFQLPINSITFERLSDERFRFGNLGL